MFLMKSNSIHLRTYSTLRRLQPIDPGAFYAVVSSAMKSPRLIPEPFTRLDSVRRERTNFGYHRSGIASATACIAIMHEKEYNNRQPTYIYPQPLLPTVGTHSRVNIQSARWVKIQSARAHQLP